MGLAVLCRYVPEIVVRATLGIRTLNGAPAPHEAFGPPLTAAGEVRMGCC